MSLRISPCKGCPDRTCGDREHDCHDTCERYLEFKAARIEQNRLRREYDLVRSATLEGMRRMKNNPPPNTGKRR